MKKFGVIFLMSCLLNFVPMAFGADNTPQMTLFSDGNQYFYQKNEARLATQLNTLDPRKKDDINLQNDDQYENVLKHIEKKAIGNTETKSSLPMFTLEMRNQEPDTLQVINVNNGERTNFRSKTLHSLFKLESTRNGIFLLNNDKKQIAVLHALTYDPNALATGTSSNIGSDHPSKNILHSIEILQAETTDPICVFDNILATEDLEHNIQLIVKNKTNNIKLSIALTTDKLRLLLSIADDFAKIKYIIMNTDETKRVALELNEATCKELREVSHDLMPEIFPKQSPIEQKPIEQKSIKSSNWRTPFAVGTLLAIFALYGVSKLEYWNKDLAPSMEAFCTHLIHSCQDMLSRIKK